MEQLVARRAHNPKVTGSSPVPATTNPLYVKYLGFFLFIYFLKNGHRVEIVVDGFLRLKCIFH